MDIFTIIVLLIAGILAGAFTGLAGASAVVVMTSILILILNMDAYIAIGLSLCTDVVASLVATRVYYKNKNINLIPAIPILLATFIGVTLGSYFSTSFSSSFLSGATGLGILTTGIIFIFRRKASNPNPIKALEKINQNKTLKYSVLALIGLIIGLAGGVFGAGGGIMLLVALIFFLGYNMHMAIGTSILIMAFMAFFGAATHFYYKPFSLVFLLISCIGAFFGARYSSIIANHISERKLRLIVGVMFVVLGVFLALESIFNVSVF